MMSLPPGRLPVPLRRIRYCKPLGRAMVPGLAALAARKAALALAPRGSSAAAAETDKKTARKTNFTRMAHLPERVYQKRALGQYGGETGPKGLVFGEGSSSCGR